MVPPLSSTLTLKVQVEHSPCGAAGSGCKLQRATLFRREVYYFSLPEGGTSPQGLVGTILARDRYAGRNALNTSLYSERKYFCFDAKTGMPRHVQYSDGRTTFPLLNDTM